LDAFEESPEDASRTAARQLVDQNQFVKCIEVFGSRSCVFGGPRSADDAGKQACFCEVFVKLLGQSKVLAVIPLSAVRCNVFLYECANLLPPLLVAV